ncbi:hypothetical protein TWF718_011055 [Orbilia javanica]|uniref:B30.2/SPRY domain-containing protein n=1 Tax=Orbilia javanica TaxID=47235 RepID=A0AAN8MKW3_9PEZI
MDDCKLDASVECKAEHNSPHASRCWEEGLRLFEERQNSGRKSKDPSKAARDNPESKRKKYTFNSFKNSCEKTIEASEKDNHARLIKFVEFLKQTDDVVGNLLQSAPAVVSAVWFGLSILIKASSAILEVRETICSTCQCLVNIIATCLLYEKRYILQVIQLSNATEHAATKTLPEESDDGGPSRAHILDSIKGSLVEKIPELFSSILLFCWEVDAYSSGPVVKSIKEIFTDTLKDLSNKITTDFQEIEKIVVSLHQENVMETMDTESNGKVDYLYATKKAEEIHADLMKRFKDKMGESRSAEVHTLQLETILAQVDKKQLSGWLYEEQEYATWLDMETDDIRMLVLRSPRGFGKSVQMALLKEKLEISQEEGPEVERQLVLCFFFKSGDDLLKSSHQALETLLSQLLSNPIFEKDDNVLRACVDILESKGSSIKHSGTGRPETDSARIAGVIEKVAKLLNTPIYIIVDAIDECEDLYGDQQLVYHLKTLARSDLATIRVIVSARSDSDIDGDIDELISQKESADSGATDLKTITIDRTKNDGDLRNYLKKKISTVVSRRVDKKKKDDYSNEVNRIVDIIHERAAGDFTKAGLAAAFINQPSRLSLNSKLEQLPKTIGQIYRNTLQALTVDERDLVIFALKWVIWGVSTVKVAEIAEHYQGIYRTKSLHRRPTAMRRVHSKGEADSGYPSENNVEPIQFRDATSDPDIRDTTHHLYRAGRDFFRFDKKKDSIDVHQSVREWILDEEKVFSSQQHDLHRNAGGLFKKDPKTGQWSLEIALPSGGAGWTADNHLDLSQLFDKRECHFSILNDILCALNNQEFQEQYMRWDPPPAHSKFWEEKLPTVAVDPPMVGIPDELKKDGELQPRSRYEINHWHDHLRILEEYWQPENSTETEWHNLFIQLTLFTKPGTWFRWHIHYMMTTWRISRSDAYAKKRVEYPIHMAAKFGLQILAHHQLDGNNGGEKFLNEFNGRGLTPLILALRSPKVVKYLIEMGAEVNQIGTPDMYSEKMTALDTALHEAAIATTYESQLIESINLLLDHNADLSNDRVRIPPLDTASALLLAARIQDTALFKRILASRDWDLTGTTDWNSRTVLHYLFWRPPLTGGKKERKPSDILKLLLAKGADGDAEDDDSAAPLAYAVRVGDLESVRILLEHGVNLHDVDYNGCNALHVLADRPRRSGGFDSLIPQSVDIETDLGILNALLENGIDPKAVTIYGETALSRAIKWQSTQIIEKLLACYDKDDNAFFLDDHGGGNLIRSAASRPDDDVSILKFLVETLGLSQDYFHKGILPTNPEVQSAITAAAQSGNQDILEFLLETPIPENKMTEACAIAFKECATRIRVLAGIDRPNGTESMDKRGNIETCMKMLLQYISKVEVADVTLFLSNDISIWGSESLMKLILRINPDYLTRLDEHGWTLMHSLKMNGRKPPIDLNVDVSQETISPSRLIHRGPTFELPISLSEDGLCVRHETPNTCRLIMADHPIPAEAKRYYFEITVHDERKGEGSSGIGLQEEKTTHFYGAMVGWSHGIGYHGDDGKIFRDTGMGVPLCPLFGRSAEPDTVGCGIDMATREVYFTLNGKYLGVKGIAKHGIRYFPALSIQQLHPAEVNFGGKPFIFTEYDKDLSELAKLIVEEPENGVLADDGDSSASAEEESYVKL